MVALLVVLTIVACLVVDGIVVSVRERRAVTAGQSVGAVPEMVFAQDGGEPVADETAEEEPECGTKP